MKIPPRLSHLVNLDRRAQGGGTEFLKPGRNGTGDGKETLGSGSVFAQGSDRFARVAADADTRIDFDLTEDRNAVGAGGAGAFAVTEDVHRLAAVRAGEGRHVFHHAQYLDVDLAEHFNSFAYVGERDRRRRGDDDGTRHCDGLNEGKLNVAGAGGQIDDEVIQLTPVGRAEELG